ncbi:MAG: hypothetical protein U0263_08600 [Polyangiaceae bacterium]
MRGAALAVLACTSLAACDPPARPSAADGTAPSASALESADARAPVGSERSPPTSTASVSGTLDGDRVELGNVRATSGATGIVVVLSNVPVECAAPVPMGAKTLTLTVPPDASGTFFEQSTFGLPVAPAAPFTAAAAMLAVDRFDRNARLLAGTLRVLSKTGSATRQADLRGSFEASLCPDENGGLASAPPRGRTLADIRGITLHEGNDSVATIDELWLFPDAAPPFSCTTPKHPNAHTFISLLDVGPPQVGDLVRRGPQPVRPAFHPRAPDRLVSGGSADPIGFGQLVWDERSPAPGRELSGQLTTWSFQGSSRADRRFRVKICP